MELQQAIADVTCVTRAKQAEVVTELDPGLDSVTGDGSVRVAIARPHA
jgi:hypothetical protein